MVKLTRAKKRVNTVHEFEEDDPHKNVRRPIVSEDIEDDFRQAARSRSDQIDQLTAINVNVTPHKECEGINRSGGH